ncbi:glycosyl transferase family 2 [Nodularia spumigena CENA596]|uniref:Glycosyl transferase family 2 n=1 Tax=Nodularia spumigena CENA596 TaxID=1819295 RepID=A0A166IMJ2_NODSP|nr:glycosyltransferase family 2 protein [Nodularia spumigena]KZL48590.1 glycosyl transferase family 2 [Nodularia spumigena CENA596]
MDYQVIAYITAYKDLQAVKNCLELLKNQSYPIQEIFVVDNSPQQIIFSEDGLLVKHCPENIGVAGGLKQAVIWAKEKDANFLWAFDQDSEPDEDLLEKLLLKYQSLSTNEFPIGIVAPLAMDVQSQSNIHGLIFSGYKFDLPSELQTFTDYYECDAVITSGSLISINAARSVELPREDLFLDAVDYLYCMNFKSKGYKIVVIKDAILKHHLGTYRQVKSPKTKTEVFTYTCSPLRYYYSCRNHTFLETRLSTKLMLSKSIICRLNVVRHHLRHIFYYEPDLTLLKAWACITGTIEGFFGRLGKTW